MLGSRGGRQGGPEGWSGGASPGTNLLLEGAGHQPPQLGQAVVDAIATAFLDDLEQKTGVRSGRVGAEGTRSRLADTHPSASLPGQNLRGGGGRHGARGRAERPGGSSGTAVTTGFGGQGGIWAPPG